LFNFVQYYFDIIQDGKISLYRVSYYELVIIWGVRYR